MVNAVDVRRFKSRLFLGKYTPNTIWIRQDLSEVALKNTFNHEYKHHLFFSKHRFLRPFLYSRFNICYLTLLCAAWLIHPILYLTVIIPCAIVCLHEVHVSIQKTSFAIGSLLLYGSTLTLMSVMLWLRIVLLWMFQ